MNQLEEGHLRKREAEKQDTIAALEEALASIEQQHREPDEWERVGMGSPKKSNASSTRTRR
ncbi:MAG: hypothetical protein WA709_33660 [Stellaceae bacterium]